MTTPQNEFQTDPNSNQTIVSRTFSYSNRVNDSINFTDSYFDNKTESYPVTNISNFVTTEYIENTTDSITNRSIEQPSFTIANQETGINYFTDITGSNYNPITFPTLLEEFKLSGGYRNFIIVYNK